jgi:mannose/cellobiose epimerase-like protein (N-acyl-D-glucosamine 2-epimerase family)
VTNWLQSATHRHWLAAHAIDLLSFARRSPTEGAGALWLDGRGAPVEGTSIHTWITARMTSVYSLGSLLGVPGSDTLATRAMSGLTGPLHDDRHGGWYPCVGDDGPAEGKRCDDHALVVVAASAAVQAGLKGAMELFDEATDVLLDRFWSVATGLCLDRWDTAFEDLGPYRGITANIRAVEAMLAAAGVCDEGPWLERALGIAEFVAGRAEDNDWRIPEHFDHEWRPILDFNRDEPADPFRPYGAMVGHGFEWGRLMIHLVNGLPANEHCWLVDAACALFDRAVDDGWGPDGKPGFVHTTDWNGRPVVTDRFHWVAAEAIAAAAVLHRHTGRERYAELYQRWWDYAATHLLDHENGSWFHQLDADNKPIDTVWPGKPDIHRAFQAALVPVMPLYPTLAAALAAPDSGW